MHTRYIVNKFGGTSMADASRTRRAREILIGQVRAGYTPVAVVSALAGVTDTLIEVAQCVKKNDRSKSDRHISAIRERHLAYIDRIDVRGVSRHMMRVRLESEIRRLTSVVHDAQNVHEGVSDEVLAFGERMASAFFALYLGEMVETVGRHTGNSLGIRTNDAHGDADIVFSVAKRNVRRKFIQERSKVVVVAGFVGVGSTGRTTTLGRGGSDTTACFLGAALGTERVILWKEVPGVFSEDPHVVPDALPIVTMRYAEAKRSGKVICEKAIQYVAHKGIPLQIGFIDDGSVRTTIHKGRERISSNSLICSNN